MHINGKLILLLLLLIKSRCWFSA